jgi:hypothetical protein
MSPADGSQFKPASRNVYPTMVGKLEKNVPGLDVPCWLLHLILTSVEQTPLWRVLTKGTHLCYHVQ